MNCNCQPLDLFSTKNDAPPNEKKFANINGIQMYYETYGDSLKQPLLLIHGNGGFISTQRFQIEFFRNKYYIIAADSRCHGKSEDGKELLTYDLMVDDYNALLDHLKIDSVYIIGQSDGGIIGLELAIKYPRKVKKLVSTGPNIRPDSSALWMWSIDLVKSQLSSVEKNINNGDTSKSLVRQKAQLNLMDKFPNMSNDDLAKIKAPVLIIAGDADIIRLEHILTIYQNIPKAHLFIMPGATHFMLFEEPDFYNQVINRFLENPFKRPTSKERLIN
jgi:Predicted hydrolases or acyltransferases (alpha/beta hydrolase superfamily)